MATPQLAGILRSAESEMCAGQPPGSEAEARRPQLPQCRREAFAAGGESPSGSAGAPFRRKKASTPRFVMSFRNESRRRRVRGGRYMSVCSSRRSCELSCVPEVSRSPSLGSVGADSEVVGRARRTGVAGLEGPGDAFASSIGLSIEMHTCRAASSAPPLPTLPSLPAGGAGGAGEAGSPSRGRATRDFADRLVSGRTRADRAPLLESSSTDRERRSLCARMRYMRLNWRADTRLARPSPPPSDRLRDRSWRALLREV
mmetsp:Transcript_12631/g.37075  ORF Transcript_12631/g.37075 Transcript_12631/m.37075 type:complete len:258 (-) Transcript_12631:2640-3413(-)